MNDFIDVKLGFMSYIHNIADLTYRYINNGALKKTLLFPLFIILLLCEIAIFPIALIGAVIKWAVYFLVSVSDDRAPMLYTLIVLFAEFFILYYVVFAILIVFYKLFDLVSNGLGKANYELNADEFIAQHEYKDNSESKYNSPYQNNENNIKDNSEIFVINTDDFKE